VAKGRPTTETCSLVKSPQPAPWHYEIPPTNYRLPLKSICQAPKQVFQKKHTEDFQIGNDVMLWDCNPSRDILEKRKTRYLVLLYFKYYYKLQIHNQSIIPIFNICVLYFLNDLFRI